MKKDLEEILENIKDKKDIKIRNDELIKTLLNFTILFLILSFLPLIPNIQTAHIILPTVFSFSPTLSLTYFIIILILYKYYKYKESKEK